jgi:translocator protein
VVAFFGQLALNVAWSFAFFGLESPGLALAVIAALLAAILATIGLFRPLDRVAAWLLAPYAAWVAYAAAVNLGVLILN